MNRSTPGLPIHHQLSESTQTLDTESVMPSNHLILSRPFSSFPQSFPALGSFQMSQLFASGGQSIGVSASTSVLPVNTQDWSPLEWTGGSPCCPRDSQESSPTPQFKSINSSALSFLYSPTLTSICDDWETHRHRLLYPFTHSLKVVLISRTEASWLSTFTSFRCKAFSLLSIHHHLYSYASHLPALGTWVETNI